MNDSLAFWLHLPPLLREEGVIFWGVLGAGSVLALAWMGLLVLTLRRAQQPARLMLLWLREWAMPVVFILTGALLLGAGGGRLVPVMDAFGGTLERWGFRLRDLGAARVPAVPPRGDAVLPGEARNKEACTRVDLVVQGCQP